jgi:hypothetical protein
MHRFDRRSFLPFLLATVVAAGSACNNSSTTTGTTTTTSTATSPTTFSVTETFTGSLTNNSAQSYSFTVQAAGTVLVTLTTLSDSVDSTITAPGVGLSLGTWNGTSCAVQTGIFTDNAGQGAAIAGTVTGAGTLCTRIYDPASRVTHPLSYTITVNHP